MEVEKDNKDFTVHPDGSITVDDIVIPPPPVPALTVEANNERLIVTELIVRDFKSYAGTHVIGPFNKNFSCIVGPNGSGKSNVIDALLFVFGYRAQKIRSKKVSVLIHNSHKFPDLPSCSVTVNFATIRDQGNDYTVLPDSKFCVTRTGYRDNSSTYEVNGRRSQYKDVASLLRKYGIDLDYNRFMILQGEIELISMMKPKAPSEQEAGMLEYIEDIIGSNRFIQPIQHFSTKVEETNEIRIEKLNQLKIIEKERADAEKPRNEAMEYLRLANEVALMQNSILQTNMRSCTEEGEKLTADRDLVQEKIKELSDSMNELQESKQIKEDEMKFIVREHEKVAKVVEEYNQQFSKLEREDVACRENMKNNKEKIKKLTKSLETEESKMINLRKQPEVLQGEIEELESKKEKLVNVKEKEEEKLKEVMGTVKDEIQEYQEEKDNLEKKLVDLKSVVHEKQSELDLAQSELDLLLNPEKKEKEALQKLETEFERIVATIEEKKKSLSQAVERVKELESQISSSKKKVEDLERKEQTLTEKVKGLQSKLDESKSSLNSSKSRNKLVKAFMEQKKMGNLSGVYGRLGDLGAIDAKYDVAISTACGPLDNMVTDTMKTAQAAVEFLKANDLGYTTFIALDQMKKWEPYTKQKISTPENVPRLFDLISVKDKALLPAFYFALRDTLVAKDIEQATRVGLKGDTRYRVVTLKGQLVEPSGAMSGGGTQCFKGRMGQSVASNNTVSEKELATLEQDIANLTNDLEGIKKQRFDLKEATEQAVKELATLQLSSKKSQQNRDSFVEQEKMLKDQIEEQKKKIAAIIPNKKKIAEMQATIQEYEKNHAKAAKAASVYETKVKELQEKIMAVTKGKYGAAQTKIDKLAKEIAQITQNITKNSSMLKNTDKNLKKAEANVNSLKEELEDCVNSVDTLKEQSKELANTGLEITEKLKEEKEKLVLIELQKAASTGEVKGISSKIHEIKSEIIERKNQVKMVEIEIRANQGQLKTLKSQISKLELHDIGEGETELPVLSPEELDNIATSSLQYEVGRIQSKMKDMKVDLSSIAEFKKKEEIYKRKLQDLESTVAERDRYRSHYEALRRQRLQEFLRGFSIITLKVKELYQMMTLGGDAELELVDSVDPFSEGIEFSVRPLRKTWKSIRNLSGGEKTLSSLSLVFALHFYRSTPFFVMDEIDAALDFRNVDIIGSYIKDCTKNAQFIVISLRENMFTLAHHLVGIYKTNNRTKNVFVNWPPPEEEVAFDKLLSQETNTAKTTTALKETNKIDSVIPDINIEDPSNKEVVLESVGGDTRIEEEIENAENIDRNKHARGDTRIEEEIENAENIDRNKHARFSFEISLDLKDKSTSKTPKKKSTKVLEQSQWSDDDDFVIGTPSILGKR